MVDSVALGVGAALCEVVAWILTRSSSALLQHDNVDCGDDDDRDSVDDDDGEIVAQILDGDGDDDDTDDDVLRQIHKQVWQ